MATGATIACASPQDVPGSTRSAPFTAPDLPRLAGQLATCGAPREKTFNLEAREAELDLGLGIRFMAWVYNGTLPGPTLEVCEGDHVTITIANHGEVSHGLDSHALRTDTMHFGPVAPGASMTIEKDFDTPGVFMYHCAAGPVTDMHIKSGLYGAMIVYPRDEQLRPARELVVVESAIFGEPDAEGVVPGTDSARAQRNDPTIIGMSMNGFRFLIGLALTSIAIGCAGTSSAPTAPSSADLAGSSNLVSIQPAGQADQPTPPGASYTLSFADGRLSTRADCNLCSGGFAVSDQTLTAGPAFACTRAACPTMAFENVYTHLLSGDSTITLSGNRLMLSSNRGVLRFRRT